MSTGEIGAEIAAVRRFNRLYTQRIGVLKPGLLDSPFTLTQARLLYELAHRDNLSAGQLCRELGLDPGYVSRILRGFERNGLLQRKPARDDARRSLLKLTTKGRKAFAPLNERSRIETGELLSPLSGAQRAELLAAMRKIEILLSLESTADTEASP